MAVKRGCNFGSLTPSLLVGVCQGGRVLTGGLREKPSAGLNPWRSFEIRGQGRYVW